MRTAPLAPVAAGMLCGIGLDHSLQPQAAVFVALFALAGLFVLLRPMRTYLGAFLIFAASAGIGGFLHLHVARTPPPSSIARHVGSVRRIARVRGVVVSQPQVLGPPRNPFAPWLYGSDRTVFLLEAESLEGLEGDVRVAGKVRVTVAEVVLDLREDERVELFGWLYPLQPRPNPGSFDWASFYRRQGVVAALACKHRENVRRLVDGPAPRGRFVTRLRSAVRGLLTSDLATGADEDASLLHAMILGHRSQLDRRLNDVFIRAGCIHFLAVSGVHVVIVMFFARLLGRALMGGPRACTWSMMLAVVVYAVVAEPRPPILRATVLALFYCVARLLGRHRACLNWISASAIALAAVNPDTIFDIGFQLSFGACLGVSYVTPALLGLARDAQRWWRRATRKQRLTDEQFRPVKAMSKDFGVAARASRWAWRRTQRYLAVGIAVTIGAWVATLPIVAFHFQRIHPWGVPNSFLVLPLVTVVMGLGFAKLMAAVLLPVLGSSIGSWLTTADALLIRFVESLGHVPGATVGLSPPPWWLTVTYYLFLGGLVWRFPAGVSWPWAELYARQHDVAARSLWAGRACVAFLALLAIGTVGWCRPTRAADRLIVTVLSVGPGLATVIELPDGRAILYDAGTSRPFDPGRSTIVPFLQNRGLSRVDRVYISHPNLDHFSGLPSILDNVPVGAVVVNQNFEARASPGSPSRHLLDLLARRRHPIETLNPSVPRWKLGEVTFEQLWPPGMLDETFTTNDTSTVLRLSYGGHAILLTGDIEDAAQRALLERGDLRADVLVLPHHGSVRPSTGDFVNAVAADVVVRSSGERRADTLSQLRWITGTASLYNTADVGAVRVVLDVRGFHAAACR